MRFSAEEHSESLPEGGACVKYNHTKPKDILAKSKGLSMGGWNGVFVSPHNLGDCCNKTIIMAVTASDCVPIHLDNGGDSMKLKLMKTMMCEVAVTHRNMLSDYLGSLPQEG